MAETERRRPSSRDGRTSGNGRSRSNGRSSGDGRSSSGSRTRRFSAADAARRASAELEELTQTPLERVTGVHRNDDDGWVVEVEGLELHRVPPTMDVLGSYEIELDSRGDVMGWRRVGRHHRSQVES